ncbi:MAG TPA: PD-(D/E)XK nuclease family protein, partial [Micromonosporaceae bacterium]|nr:PD-(D/E)XK nuclease family protein [Micromonosporaceae bacterium]
AGIPGADPDGWYGLPALSSTTPVRDKGMAVSVTPSTVERLIRCPLRWMVERHGGADPAELAAVTGILVHALAEAAASGADEAGLRAELDRAWDAVDAGAPWFSRRERARVHAMVETFLTWLRGSRDELTQVAVEQDVTVDLPEHPDGPRVRLRGRIDRIEADRAGRPVVVDIKTGKVPISEADAKEHPQLALYQLAAAHGAFQGLGLAAEPGGARLLYLAKRHRTTGAAERAQAPLDDPDRWLDTVHAAAQASTGPDFVARQTPDCARCPARFSCPLHPSGRQVP